MFYFHPIRTKQPPIVNLFTVDIAKYVYKMATTAGPSCGEVGMKISKQELSNFQSSSRNNWMQKLNRVNTTTFHHTHKCFKC